MVTTTNSRVGQRKNQNVETLRGIAIIALVAFHVIGVSGSAGLNVPPNSVWRWFADSLGFIRMPLFTFLSGVVYAAYAPMRSGMGRFVRSKARRLLLPMVCVGAIFLTVQSLAPGTNRDLLGEEPWFMWLILPVAHFWFLPALFWIFVLFALLDVRHLMDSARNLWTLLGLTVAASVLIGPLFDRNWLGFEGSLYLLPFFTFGVICARLGWQRQALKWRLLSVAALAVAFTWIQLGLLGVVPAIAERHELGGILASFAALLAVFGFPFQVRALAWLGQFAYPIFLFHVFGSAGARIVLLRLGVEITWIHFLAGVLLALALGIVADKMFCRFNATNVVLLGNKLRPRHR